MRLIPVQTPRFNLNRDVMILDDAEMTLQMTEFAGTTGLKDRHTPSAKPSISPDFLLEMYSAASMIMDRAEIESMMHEIELSKLPHIVAA